MADASKASQAIAALVSLADWKTATFPAGCLEKPPEVAAAFHALMCMEVGEDPLGEHGPRIPCAFATLLGGCGTGKQPPRTPCVKCSRTAQWAPVPRPLMQLLRSGASAAMATRIKDTG